MNRVFRKESHTVVFDVGSSTIKIIKGYIKEEIINIEHYRIFPIPQGTVQEGKVVDKKGLSEELCKLKIKASDIRLLLSSKDIILRTFQLPKMELSEVRQAVKFEMSVLLPDEIENYIVDGVVMSEYKEASEEDQTLNMYEVQGIAVERKTVTDYVDCFSKAGFKINVVDVQPNAISKLLCHDHFYMRKMNGTVLKNQNIAVLDIGYEKTSITFIEDKKIFIYKILNKGGRDFTKAIAKDFHMSFQEAEEWKLDNPFSSMEKEEFKGKEEVNNLLLEIIQELTQLMEFFESMCKDKRIDYILLLGGGSLMPICKKYIESALQVETECFFALHSICIKELHPANHITLLANAIGALVRREKKNGRY